MNKQQLDPARLHPAEVAWEEIDARGWSIDRLSEESGIDRTRLWMWLVARSPTITSEIAAGLSKAFGTSDQLWIKLGAAFDEKGGDA